MPVPMRLPTVEIVQLARGDDMQRYLVVRRSAWLSEQAHHESEARSIAEAARMTDEIACIHSYVLEECDRTLGSFCIVEAASPEAVRRHAVAADLPVDEIVKIAAVGVAP